MEVTAPGHNRAMTKDDLIALLTEADIDHDAPDGSDFVAVILPGTRRLKTVALLIPGSDYLRIEAFICRAVEEKHADVYRFLLQRNNKTFGVAYTIDANNDIYLAGYLPSSITAQDLDRVLGQLLDRADNDFNRMLEMGFEESIRKEWVWRLSRGESTRNLEAFDALRPADE